MACEMHDAGMLNRKSGLRGAAQSTTKTEPDLPLDDNMGKMAIGAEHLNVGFTTRVR